jgi:hypothetical protein
MNITYRLILVSASQHQQIEFPHLINQRLERSFMKKVLTAIVLASALVASSTVAHAADAKPTVAKKVKKVSIKQGAAGAEGTAGHEMSETSGTQNAEGTGAVKKHAKKAGMKKAAKATTK